MLVKLLQAVNAPIPIDVTLSGIVMLVKLLQLEKALCSRTVTLFGIDISVRLVQFEKALEPIPLIPELITTFFMRSLKEDSHLR